MRTANQKGVSLLEVLISAQIVLLAAAAFTSLLIAAEKQVKSPRDMAAYLLMNKVDDMAVNVRASQWLDPTTPMAPGTYGPENVTLAGKNYKISYSVSDITGRPDMRKMNAKVVWEENA